MTTVSLGFLVALPDEAKSLLPKKPHFESIIHTSEGHYIGISGAGPVRAEAMALHLVQQGISGIISWGCAGALEPRLLSGHLLLPRAILDVEESQHDVDPIWHASLCKVLTPYPIINTGKIIESRKPLFASSEKKRLFTATEAVAVDMESAGVARVAKEHTLPFLVVRSVVDPAHMTLPKAVTVALQPRGAICLSTLLVHCMYHPYQIIELIRLGIAFQRAMDTLRHVRMVAGPDLCFPPLPNYTRT